MGTLRELLQEDLAAYGVEFRIHATRKMFEREISSDDVDRVLAQGQIIESYDDELPFRHLLVSGRVGRRPLHVALIVNMNEKRLTVITTYEPDPHHWTRGFTRRRR